MRFLLFLSLLFNLALSQAQCLSQIYQVRVLDSISCTDTATFYARFVEVKVSNPQPTDMLAVTAYGQSTIVTGPKETEVFKIDLPKNGNYVTITAGLFTHNSNQCSFWTINNIFQNPTPGACRTKPFPVDVLAADVNAINKDLGRFRMRVRDEINLSRYELTIGNDTIILEPSDDPSRTKVYEVEFKMSQPGENLIGVRAIDMDGSVSFSRTFSLWNPEQYESRFKVWNFSHQYLGELQFETMPRNSPLIIRGVESGEVRKIIIVQ